jgi:rhamnose utilization protein RhaD (predicted bifunctional aldolase and dehydrogenase)/NAD(P)-dependent dehydrogenase (short-subunit alcohol dehydrogenase family)
MRSRYDEREANEFVRRYAGRASAELALRVYTSRLIGADAELVLHGGGNTSVKSVAHEVTGEECEVLFVKGSGWDLQSIEPEGFPACRLHPLRRMCALPELSDEQMVQGLRSQMLNPASPTPSVEALLHAFLPARFVDHTHANAVLAVVDQPDAERRAHEVWRDGLLFVPYIMPGFVLARRIVELWTSVSSPALIVLEKHGILTWGASALESYERMIAAVSAAETYVSAARVSASVPAPALSDAARKQQQRRLSPLLRGALARGPDGQRVVLQWRDEPAILQLLARPDAETVTQIGPITPDHVIRTKPLPLWLELAAQSSDDGSDAETQSRLGTALHAFAERYEAYFNRFAHEDPRPLTLLDRRPRLVLLPGLGAVALGGSLAEAQITGDLYAHTARVVQDALALGSYRPVNERELFEVEYWSLEQAKLKLAKSAPRPLDGRIAVVTGAASGIGLATARHLLELGAHVVASDRDAQRLQAAAALLGESGGRLATCTTDVRDEADVATLFDFTLERFAGLDIVVSNAGTAPSGWLHDAAGHAALIGSLEINLIAHQHVARAAAAIFIRQGIGGCLLFNASKSAFNPGPEFGPYAVAKAGLIALMRQYAVDLGSHGVRSNAINADRVRTELFGGGVLEARAKARGIDPQRYFEQNLLGRETRAEDVAHAFGWLARAEATTGAVLTVDGGNPAAFPR